MIATAARVHTAAAAAATVMARAKAGCSALVCPAPGTGVDRGTTVVAKTSPAQVMPMAR